MLKWVDYIDKILDEISLAVDRADLNSVLCKCFCSQSLPSDTEESVICEIP